MKEETKVRHAVGRMFAVSLPTSWRGFDLDRYPVANYIVFAENMGSSFKHSRERLVEARWFLRDKHIDPLFMMDEEGGRVTQISTFFQSAPSPRAVAKVLRPEEAEVLYAQMSAYVADLGIDINLFPCVDVNTDPLNPIIGTRSYGKTLERVCMYSHAAISSSRPHTASVAKHFPGHGMTRIDSHRQQPVVDIQRDELERTHVTPFREAIRSGVDGIMVGHCLYVSHQTNELPASLSKQIVGGLLRDRLKYDRLVLTDSLDMQAVTKNVDPRRVGLLALEAGCDMLLYTEYSERFRTSFDAVVDAFLMGRLDEDHLRDRNRRRARLIEHLRFEQATRTSFDERQYMDLLDRVRKESVQIDDPAGTLPLSCDEVVIVTTPTTIREELRRYVSVITDGSDPSHAVGKALIVWLMEPLHPSQSFENVRALIERSATSILVTAYDSIPDLLPACDVTIMSDDTSPHVEAAIIQKVFKGQAGTP